MSKYYKNIQYGFIVKVYTEISNEDFEGVVVAECKEMPLHEEGMWLKERFAPYTPTPQELAEWGETVSNDNTNKVEVSNKDINLRLECLKLAVNSNKGIKHDASVIVAEAQEFYDWITKKD